MKNLVRHAVMFIFVVVSAAASESHEVIKIDDLPDAAELRIALLSGPRDSFVSLADLIAEKVYVGEEKIRETVLASGSQHKLYLSMFGNCTGVDIYRDFKEGPFRSISMAFKMKEAATTWTFNFYNNGDGRWRLVSFNSDTITAYFNGNGRQGMKQSIQKIV